MKSAPTETLDVLVVGAGPAGCAAALAAKRAGLRTLVSTSELTRGEHRPQTIETVGPAVILTADQLGIRHCFAEARAGSVQRFMRDGRPAELEPSALSDNSSSWHICRQQLDRSLRSAVAASGVEMAKTQVVKVHAESSAVRCSLSDGRTLNCRWVVDAAGRRSKSVPRTRQLISPPLLVATGIIPAERSSPDTAATCFDRRSWGWVWRTTECGPYIVWTAMIGADLPRASELASMLRRSRPGSVKRAAATWQINLQRHPRILPVGDAAGSLDPASGHGLANALSTAIAAIGVCRSPPRGAVAEDAAATAYHDGRIRALLLQADELARRYGLSGILTHDE